MAAGSRPLRSGGYRPITSVIQVAIGRAPETATDSAYEEFAYAAKMTGNVFPDKQDWQIDRTRPHVVAFVQDARTGDVLQAEMIPVSAGLTL